MSREPAPPRDTDASPFAEILGDLLARVPGALAAALVDEEGECVDYTGTTDPYDLKVAAAHFSIVLAEAAERLGPLGAPRTLLVRCERKTFLVQSLPERYAMIVILRARAGFASSARAIGLCERALAAEASWTAPAGPSWHPIRVECKGRRPARIASDSQRPRAAHEHGSGAPRMHAVEVLGALVLADARERGFRVRLDTGVELTVVREAGGFWYADEAIPTASAREDFLGSR
jgi:predicted regulator of Ras-like GTPase activity (Roadblock/LC7/MglB family)